MRRRAGSGKPASAAAAADSSGGAQSAKAAAGKRAAPASGPPAARCCSWRVCFLGLLLLAVVPIIVLRTEAGRLRVMRLVRDVSRYKAAAALRRDPTGLLPMLLGQEPPSRVSREDEESATVFTAAELAQYDGSDGGPIYLSITGRVYDVTKGRGFYGPGRSYHFYVAKDATRSYATGCLKPDCLISSLAGLTAAQKREAERWVDFYEYHRRYRFVGVLREDPVDHAVERAWALEEAMKDLTAEQLTAKGSLSYGAGDFAGALEFWPAALLRLGEAQRGDAIAVVRQRAMVLMYMVAACHKQGDVAQAMEYVQEALDSLEEALGPEASASHPLVARATSDQAVLLMQEGRVDEARAGFLQAVQTYDRALAGMPGSSAAVYVEEAGGRELIFREAAGSRHHLARLHEMTHAFGQAMAVAQEVLDAFKGASPEQPPMVEQMLGDMYELVQRLEALYDGEYEEGGFEDLY